jgi:hypothetical protein
MKSIIVLFLLAIGTIAYSQPTPTRSYVVDAKGFTNITLAKTDAPSTSAYKFIRIEVGNDGYLHKFDVKVKFDSISGAGRGHVRILSSLFDDSDTAIVGSLTRNFGAGIGTDTSISFNHGTAITSRYIWVAYKSVSGVVAPRRIQLQATKN